MGATGGKGSADGIHRQRRDNENEPRRGPDSGRRASGHDQRPADRSARPGANGIARGKQQTNRGSENAAPPNRNKRGSGRPAPASESHRPFGVEDQKTSAPGQRGTRHGQHPAQQGHTAPPQRDTFAPPHPERGANTRNHTPAQRKGQRTESQRDEGPQPQMQRRNARHTYQAEREPGHRAADQYHDRNPAQHGTDRPRGRRAPQEQEPDRRRPGYKALEQPGKAPGSHRAADAGNARNAQTPRRPATRGGQGTSKPIGFGANNGLRHPRGSGADVGFGRQDPARNVQSNSRTPGFGQQHAHRDAGEARSGYRQRTPPPGQTRTERGEDHGTSRPASSRQRRGAPGFGPRRRPGS
jgi:hypothetical protein